MHVHKGMHRYTNYNGGLTLGAYNSITCVQSPKLLSCQDVGKLLVFCCCFMHEALTLYTLAKLLGATADFFIKIKITKLETASHLVMDLI